MKRKIKSDSGFTLAELLIVVAIIGVLVAIAIPIFTGQLEKSREAVDLSDVRSAYAEVMMAAITEDTSAMYTKNGTTIYKNDKNYYQIIVNPLKQQKPGWDTPLPITIGGVSSSDKVHWQGDPGAGGSCEITYWPDSDSVTFVWSGGTSGGGGNGDTSGGDGENTGGGTDSGASGGDNGDGSDNGNNSGNTNTGGNTSAKGTMSDPLPYPPTKESIVNSFDFVIGNVYSWCGKLYVAAHTASFTPYYYEYPYNTNQFIPPTGTYYTEADVVDHRLYNLKCGDIFKTTNGDMYIMKESPTAQFDPLYEPNNPNWIKINTTN